MRKTKKFKYHLLLVSMLPVEMVGTEGSLSLHTQLHSAPVAVRVCVHVKGELELDCPNYN